MAYTYAACTVHVTILSSGSKFPTVSNFTVTTSNSDARPHTPKQYVLRHAIPHLTCSKATMQDYAPDEAYLGRFEVRSKTTLMVTVCIHCLI